MNYHDWEILLLRLLLLVLYFFDLCEEVLEGLQHLALNSVATALE